MRRLIKRDLGLVEGQHARRVHEMTIKISYPKKNITAAAGLINT
jgi:hypothetical protein